LAKANGIKLSAVIQAGQTLKLPASKATAGGPSSGGSHTIQSGDTFSSISRQYNVPVESLLAANPGLNAKSLKPGQKILLASAAKTPAAKPEAAKADSPPEAEPTTPERVPDPEPAVSQAEKPPVAPSTEPAAEPAEEKVRTVVVDAEMTFGEFATQHGSDIKRLNELNGLDLAGTTVLAKGSELYVPTQPQATPQP
jgi:LysM repeat protein